MVRTLPKNFIHKDRLLKTLEQECDCCKDKKGLKKLGKNELCWKAYDLGKLNDIQLHESLVKRTSTIPCYLMTHVKDKIIIDLIERYVIAYSILFARGSYVANLVTQKLLPSLEQYPKSFPEDAFCPIPSIMTNENIMKKCFYPERWYKNNSQDKSNVDPVIVSVMTEFSHLLEDYLPDTNLLCNTGWDNALNHMGTSYTGHIKVQVLTHLPKRLESCFKKTKLHEDTNASSFFKLLKFFPAKPSTDIHKDDFERMMTLRNALKLKHNQVLKEAFSELNDYNWSLHLWLQMYLQDDKEAAFSLTPVVTLNRKYAYLDNKILKSLLPTAVKKKMNDLTKEDDGSEIQKLLGLTSRLFNKNRSNVRKKLRKRDARHNKQMKRKKKKKWKQCGRSSLPKDAKIVCISTDGVGLRLCCEFVPKRPIIETGNDQLFPENSLLKGTDTGRVRLATSVDSDGDVSMMKRKAYYFAQRHHRFEQWEASRRIGEYKDALEALSQSGGFKNSNIAKWTSALTIQHNHFQILKQEQVIDKERALKKMARFRWKKSWLDRRCREFLKPASKDKRHMIIGFGDGDFACVGKGELAVPTEGLKSSLHKAIKMLKVSRQVKIVIINEYNTTKCCHSCGNEMDKLMTHGRECYRYRLCTKCNETNGKRRHRDVNAAKNILHLLKCRVKGLVRPYYLRCPWKPEINVALPPLVRTAQATRVSILV